MESKSNKLLTIPAKFLYKYFAQNTVDIDEDSGVPYKPEPYAIAPRSSNQYKNAYEHFDNLFNIFLSKFSDSYPIKEIVKIPYNAKIILFGVPVGTSKSQLFVRCAIDDQNRLFGIVLDAPKLGIDLQTGDTLNIDSCIYATYYGMIRSAVITQYNNVKSNSDLNQKVSTYLYLLFLKAIGTKQYLSREKQIYLHLATVYVYYKHYYGMKDSAVHNLLLKEYNQIIKPDIVNAFYTKYKNILTKLNYTKQLPRFLSDVGIIKVHPNEVLLNMFKLYGLDAFTSIMFSLDTLIALCVTSKYPASDLFSSSCVVSSKLQSAVEDDIIPLVKKVKIVKSKYTT